MPLTLNEEQQMLRDSAQSFLNERAPVSHLRKLRDSADPTGFDRDLWRAFGEMGFAGVLIPEQYGGVGLGIAEAGIIAEQLGHTLTPSPFLSSAVLSASALVQAGSDAQRSQWLPRICAGDAVLALAIDETSNHRPRTLATTATATRDGYRLDGEKCFVVDGHVANALLVCAGTISADGMQRGTSLFLIDADAPGVTRSRTVMVDAHNAAHVTLLGVQVDSQALVGEPDTADALISTVLDIGRAMLCMQLLGIADEVFARTLAYLKERKQFDRTIGEFQALQHRMAALYCDIELARALAARALEAMTKDPVAARAVVSAAKARCCASANLAVCEAVQMHGGMGMTDAFDIGLFMKRARVAQQWLGDANFHADRYAQLNAY
jgi:alkylation response protein AidB-like acyl-CoA dehydrogenase